MGAADAESEHLQSVPEAHTFGPGRGSPAARPDHSWALTEIYRDHNAALVRFIAVRTGSIEDAREIMQEAYARVLALDRPSTVSVLVGYLWRTAVNLATDRWRERSRRDRFLRSARPLVNADESSAESTLESRERLSIVERAIANLPPKCLQAFVLHVLKGLTCPEVGREMGISEQMARRYVARALEYLQFCLDVADDTGSAK